MADKRIRIILDSKGAQRNADQLNSSVKGVGRSADSSSFSMNRLAVAIASVISIQKVTQYADAWTNVQNQLRQTTKSSEELVSVSSSIVEIARNTRAELEGTAQLYTRFRLAIEETTISDERLLSVVETINQQLALSGATAQEAAGALRQLSQGIASGVLRGEEFNSVAEQAPGILRAVSNETGLAVGQLREFAAQGGITSELLIASLENYKDASTEAFGASEATLSQSLQVARTNLISFVGQLDDASGASSALGSAIVDLSSYISSPEFISGLLQAFESASLTIDRTSDSLTDFSNELQLLSDIGGDALSLLGDAFTNLLPNIRGLVQVVTVELASSFERFKVISVALFDILSNPFDTSAIKTATDQYKAEMERINGVREESIVLILEERDAIISTAESNAKLRIAEANARKADRDARRNEDSGPTASGFKGLGGGDEKKSSREVDSAKAVTRSLEQELQLRQTVAQIYRDTELSYDTAFYDQKLAIIRRVEAEQLAIAQSRATEEAAQREERLAATLENEKLTQEARMALKIEFDQQEMLAAQILEEEKTAILQEGVNARVELERAEAQARLANAGALGNALINLGQGQSKKIFKIGQTLALAQAAVALPTAVMESFKNGGGYPWGLIPAAAMLATGIKNIQQIKSAGSGLGGGGGGSVPTPSLGGGGTGTGPQIPSTANSQELPQQRRIIDLRGVKSDDRISVAAFAALLEEDGAIVTLENARENAERRNVIGVSAR